MDVERDKATLADTDAFIFEQLALHRRTYWIVDRDPPAQLAGLADHALPRQPIAGLGRLHRGARDPRAARDAGELGDLAVGRDAASRNPADHAVDLAVQAADMFLVIGRHRAPHATTGS